MLNKLFLTAGLAVLFSAAASAATVAYSTSGSELCLAGPGCAATSQTFGNVTMTFTPVSSTVDTAILGGNSIFSSFGDLVISCVGGGTACGPQVLPSGLTLYINITQTQPTNGSGSIPGGTIAGALAGTASSASITWPVANAVTIGSVQYSVANNPLALVPVSSNGGLTSVQAVITSNAVPEPSTYALIAAGLVAIGLRRRK